MSIQTINPNTNQTVTTFEELTEEALEAAVAQATTAFESWKKTSYPQRADLLHKVAALMREKKEARATTITLEMGKLIAQAEGEILLSADILDYYADHGQQFLADQHLAPQHGQAFIRHSPVGVLLGVEPWNFPFYQVARFAAPNIMIGNTVLVKHASNVPQCALALEKIFHDAGVPPACFRTLLIGSDLVEKLIADDRLKAVTLTGSEGAGSAVAATAGQHIKKTVLELGGSDPFIVLADADVAAAAKAAAQSRMINAGQSCIAAKRFIVEKPVIREFISQLKTHLLALRTGDPLDETTQYGPLARPDLADELTQQVEDTVLEGAKIELHGGQSKPGTALFRPMILSNIKPGQRAYSEELFGPVALVLEAKNAADAVRLANDSRFGLGAAVWTKDAKKGEAMARQIESGAVFVNGLVKSMPELPFGGVKKSGYGRELSYLGIREFVNQKSIWIGKAAVQEAKTE